MEYKYPFISNKKLFKATMFACKMIRDTGYFNKACDQAASYYGVDRHDVEREVRKRQSVGQRKSKVKRKYYWFTCCRGQSTCEGSQTFYNNPFIKRATCPENIGGDSVILGTGSYYDIEYFVYVMNKYASKKEAEENLSSDFAKMNSY